MVYSAELSELSGVSSHIHVAFNALPAASNFDFHTSAFPVHSTFSSIVLFGMEFGLHWCAQGQGHSEGLMLHCLSVLYFLDHSTRCKQTRRVDVLFLITRSGRNKVGGYYFDSNIVS